MKSLLLYVNKTLPKRPNKTSGFTIVELLIVIVIIGILAALVITVYNGIQQRASNTSRAASAKELQKLVNAYIIQEGKYPPVAYACLGTGYTDWDGDSSLDCYVQGVSTLHPSATLNNELQKIAPIPTVEISNIPATGSATNLRGYMHYPNQVIDGKPGRSMLIYFLQGTNQNCGVPEVLTNGTGGYETNGAINNIPNYYGNTRCIVAITEP